MKKKCLLMILIFSALPGCSSFKPWVKAYERQNLADSIMLANRHPISSAYLHHVLEAREGARGAAGTGSAGCGCN